MKVRKFPRSSSKTSIFRAESLNVKVIFFSEDERSKVEIKIVNAVDPVHFFSWNCYYPPCVVLRRPVPDLRPCEAAHPGLRPGGPPHAQAQLCRRRHRLARPGEEKILKQCVQIQIQKRKKCEKAQEKRQPKMSKKYCIFWRFRVGVTFTLFIRLFLKIFTFYYIKISESQKAPLFSVFTLCANCKKVRRKGGAKSATFVPNHKIWTYCSRFF